MSKDEDSLELIFDIARNALATQQEQKASLENKANMLLVFSGGILALLMNAWNTLIAFPILGQQIILASVAFFSLSIIFAFSATWVRKFRLDPNPHLLAQHYLNRPENETKLQLISNWTDTWKFNLDIIEGNAFQLRIAFGLQVIAFLLLGIAFGLAIFR